MWAPRAPYAGTRIYYYCYCVHHYLVTSFIIIIVITIIVMWGQQAYLAELGVSHDCLDEVCWAYAHLLCRGIHIKLLQGVCVVLQINQWALQ